MPASQANIGPNTPMGANLLGTGATFRAWAPNAAAVYVCYDGHWSAEDSNLLVKDENGYWAGFIPGLQDGTQYKFYVIGKGSRGYKRDPYARALTFTPPFPQSNCIAQDPARFAWHDQNWRPPFFHELIIYQLHVGSFFIPAGAREGGFLDLLRKLDYFIALGINAIELLPIVEFPTTFSLGYNGTDLFSPEMSYAVHDAQELQQYLGFVNQLLQRRGKAGITIADLQGSTNQLKILIDIMHLYGIAVIFDVVYNHAGGDFDSDSIFFFDRDTNGNNNKSQFFTDQGWAGGLVFAFWKQEVRQFLIDNACSFQREYHIDGFRYDEVSVILTHSSNGWNFCQDLSDTVRNANSGCIQIAECWPVDSWIVKPSKSGGAGFDSCWDDGMRESVRAALNNASAGQGVAVNLDAIASSLRRPIDFGSANSTVEYLESHDEVLLGRAPRIAKLADSSNSHSWYARSRARVATGLLLTSPGIPMLFMGQEFLEDKQWSDDLDGHPGNLIWWGGLDGGDKPMTDYLRFVQELIALRKRQLALQRGSVNVFHVHNQNRVIAFHRWIEGEERDVIIVASLSESTQSAYRLGFPSGGNWLELLNTDIYDNWVNPWASGNGGRVDANGPAWQSFSSSAEITIPANSLLIFGRS